MVKDARRHGGPQAGGGGPVDERRVLTSEGRVALEHLEEDAAGRPHVRLGEGQVAFFRCQKFDARRVGTESGRVYMHCSLRLAVRI